MTKRTTKKKCGVRKTKPRKCRKSKKSKSKRCKKGVRKTGRLKSGKRPCRKTKKKKSRRIRLNDYIKFANKNRKKVWESLENRGVRRSRLVPLR